jgi:hypothetical protein
VARLESFGVSINFGRTSCVARTVVERHRETTGLCQSRAHSDAVSTAYQLNRRCVPVMLLTVLRMRRARALTFFVSADVNICALAHGGHVRRFGRAQLSVVQMPRSNAVDPVSPFASGIRPCLTCIDVP